MSAALLREHLAATAERIVNRNQNGYSSSSTVVKASKKVVMKSNGQIKKPKAVNYIGQWII